MPRHECGHNGVEAKCLSLGCIRRKPDKFLDRHTFNVVERRQLLDTLPVALRWRQVTVLPHAGTSKTEVSLNLVVADNVGGGGA
jgi:hypothetical protein